MKAILAILLVIMVSGCVYQDVDSGDLKKAIYFCGSVSNVQTITESFAGGGSITCFDGSYSTSREIKIPSKQN